MAQKIMLDSDAIVYEYCENNKSINAIAKEYKVSWNTIKRILCENNVYIISNRNQSIYQPVNTELFKTIDSEESAYWLGFLYADGSVKRDKNEISLVLQEQDLDSVIAFKNFVGNKNSIFEKEKMCKDGIHKYYGYSFSSNEVKQNLCNLGCVPVKTSILKFPTIQQVPDYFIYDFVRGYIDGDGYIQFDFGQSRYRIIILGTYDFLSGLVKRLNIQEYSNIYKREAAHIYALEIGHKNFVYEFLNRLYGKSTVHLERKYKVYMQARKTLGL